MTKLVNRLKHLRQIKGLSIRDFAKIMNLHENTYAYYERGDRQVPLNTLNSLATYHEVTTDYLLGRTDRVVAKEMDESQLDDEQLKLIQNLVKNMSKKKRD